MLEISDIRENHKEMRKRLEVRNFEDVSLLEKVIEIDNKRKEAKKEVDDILSELNSLSREIGDLFKSGDKEKAEIAKEKTSALKKESKEKQEQLKSYEASVRDVLVNIPNIPHPSVPPGSTESDNELIREGGTKAKSKGLVPHWELGKKLNILDFDLGNKITGSGFPVYLNDGALLQRGLARFFLDEARKQGYNEIIPPYMVNEASAFSTGQLPDKEGQMYNMREDPYYLIPTAEVPVTNIYRDEIISEENLPVKLTSFSPCFRREAGSYGKEVRGLNRVHQFEKVEIVQIVKPESSYEVLENMVTYVESLLKKLELPYRIVKLCGGDLGFTSALTYDMEVHAGAQDRWLEVSSVSNFETYQSNRLKLRIRSKDKKKVLAHTLNGSALALPRIVACIMENFQEGDKIRVPEVLKDYVGKEFLEG